MNHLFTGEKPIANNFQLKEREYNMKISIEFFHDDFIKAIGAGVYEIIVSIGEKSKSLYIGESVWIMVRCATHLFMLKNKPEYFGFTKDTIERADITITFKLVEEIDNSILRKSTEKELIATRKPLSQSGISDRQKSIDDKINALNQFINNH